MADDLHLHPSIHFPCGLWAQGWGYSGQDANLSLGTERFQPTVSRE